MVHSLGVPLRRGGKHSQGITPPFLLIVIGVVYCLFTLLVSNIEGSTWAHPTKGDHLNFFPANLGFLVGSLTGVLIFWLIIQEFTVTIFESAGRLSLTIYVLHFIPLTIMSDYENDNNWNVMEASRAVILFTTAWLIFAFVWNRFQWLTIERLVHKLSRY